MPLSAQSVPVTAVLLTMTKPSPPESATHPVTASVDVMSTAARSMRGLQLKIVSSAWNRTQNSSQLGELDLDGLTPAHLPHDHEPDLVAHPLLVDADAVEAAPAPAAASRVLDESPFAAATLPRRSPKPVSPFGRGVLNVFLLVALAPAVVVGVAALAVRLGWLDWRIGYGDVLVGQGGDMSLALKVAFVGAVTGALGFFVALFTSPRKLLGRALLNIAITAVTLTALGWLYDYAAKSPPVHDVATDWVEPLTFSDATMARRGRGAQPVDLEPVVAIDRGAFAGRPVSEINAEACPAARPVIVEKAPAEAFAAARSAAEAAGMQITVADAANGRIEAVATSPIYGFRDDVVIRVRQHAAGSRVDARAVARERDADFGANCERISGLMAALR